MTWTHDLGEPFNKGQDLLFAGDAVRGPFTADPRKHEKRKATLAAVALQLDAQLSSAPGRYRKKNRLLPRARLLSHSALEMCYRCTICCLTFWQRDVH